MPENQHPLRDKPESAPHPLRDKPASEKEPKQVGLKVEFEGSVKTPYVTYALLLINVLIFVLRYVNLDFAIQIIQWGVGDTDAILQGRELYRLFTSMFLHLNETHILFNGLALYNIGTFIERIFGHQRFAIIYLLGGLAGSVLACFFDAGGLGASGAIFAIWGAELVYLYLHRQLFGAKVMQRIRSSLLLMGMNFALAFIANNTDSGVRISNAAHFGGLVGGAILTWLISPRFSVKRIEVTSPNQAPVLLVDTNPLKTRITVLLYYGAGLAAALLLAMLVA